MRRLVFAAFYIFVFVIIGLIAFTAIAHPFDVLRAEAAAPAAVPVYKETAATWPIVAAQGTGDKEKSKKKEAPIRKQVRKTVTMKGTWYTGDKLGTVGAGGKLKSGETLALNNSQRRALKIQYGGRVYIKAPRKYRLTGYWTVMDTGCRKGIADFYYSSRSRVPAKFRRDGVVKVKVVVIRRAYQ
jgi:3D (Asp-Asp-Asp) domain-containing protein